MSRPQRRILDPRHRFRDRLLAGMLVVALLPLAIFGLLVAADLGGITSRTVDEAHRTIRSDLEGRQQTAVADRARLADARLAAIAAEVRQLRDAMSRSLAATPPTTALPAALTADGAAEYSATGTNAPSTLVVRTGAEAASAQPAAAASTVAATMAGLRRAYPEIEVAFVMRRSSGMLFTVPGFDVAGALDTRRLDPLLPQLRGAQDVFAASQSRMASADEPAADWVQPGGGAPQSAAGPYWTDAYPGMEDGNSVITAWMPLPDGDTIVGVDLSLAQLADDIMSTPVTTASSADTLLLSSSNMVLAGAGDLQRDFDLPPQAGGAFLPAPPNGGFAAGLRQLERTGRFTVLEAPIGGTSREFIAAPMYSSHWLLATAVPVSDFEPDLAALTKGVDSGIRGLYVGALPVLLLLLLLAFLLATILARRLVVPVRALTAAAGRLAQGHTEVAVPVQGSDEVGRLAESLERMRRDINSSREEILAASRELEERVTVRTRELRARNEELVALNELASSLSRSLVPEQIIRDALSALRAIVPAGDAHAYLVRNGRLASVGATDSTDDEDRSLADVAARSVREEALVDRIEDSVRVVAVPLVGGEGALGALVVRTRGRPAEQTLRLYRAIGDQVGLALRTAALSAESQKTAVLSERARLAREIHDTLAQQLTAVVLQLEVAEGLVGRDNARAESAVETARDMARSALQEARRSVWDLRPTPLTATGLVAALAAEVDAWRDRSGIAASFRSHGVKPPLALSPVAEVALLRILQEALTNVARHSRATRVAVRIEKAEQEVRLFIVDDGAGFATEETREGSFGLVGMAERARLAGGTLTVTSVPGEGTTLCVAVPLDESLAVPA